MAQQVASLFVKLGADVTNFTRAMGTVKGELTGMSANLQSLGTKISGIGQIMTLGLTLPITGIGFAAIKSASDTVESMNKVNVVFGESADAVRKFAEGSAESLGISNRAALEAAGTFGNLLTSMGMTQVESAGMSTKLVKLAADLASFNNMDPTEVLEKLRSGLVGEVEPLRTLGVNLLESEVAAKALKMGLAATAKELTYSDKVTARYALILDQTKNAQGDFARTSGDLANSQRILRAELEDAAASLGTKLLPIVLDVTHKLTGLVDAFTKLSPEMQNAVLIGGGLLAVIGPLAMGLGGVLAVIGLLASPIGLIVVGLAALAGAVIYAYTHSETFRGIVDAVIGRLGDLANFIINTGIKAIEGLSGAVNNAAGFVNDLSGVVNDAFAVVRTAIETALGAATSTLDTFGGAISGIIGAIQGLLDWIARIPSSVGVNVQTNETGTASGGGGGGTRAVGGPVTTGMSYLVGERGPELFVPATSGVIVPNARMGTAQPGGIDYDRLGRAIVRAIQHADTGQRRPAGVIVIADRAAAALYLQSQRDSRVAALAGGI